MTNELKNKEKNPFLNPQNMIKLIKKLGYRVDDCQWTKYNINIGFRPHISNTSRRQTHKKRGQNQIDVINDVGIIAFHYFANLPSILCAQIFKTENIPDVFYNDFIMSNTHGKILP